MGKPLLLPKGNAMGNWEKIVAYLKDFQLYENTLDRWAIALAVAIAALVVFRIINGFARRRAARLAEKRDNEWFKMTADLLGRTKLWFLLALALYLGAFAVQLAAKAEQVLQSVVIVVLLVQMAYWGIAMVNFAINRYAKRRMETDAASVTMISAVGFLGKVAIWSVVALLALDNMGVDITAMVAGLGVGGIAVALAAQNILGDLFASLSIVLDRPFVLGDFIIVDDKLGAVEHVGLKTTRLRSLTGEQLVFSNNDLLQSRIHNYKRMVERRIPFSIGVTYQTPHETLKEVPAILREAVEAQENVRFDRAHFKQYGDFAIVFEVVYYVLGSDYALYMDIQQAINLHIHRRFEEEGIEFAYPTQTILLQQS